MERETLVSTHDRIMGTHKAAHTYCNKRKGNIPEVDKWRHPAMPPLTVADTGDRGALVLPRKSKARSTP